MHFYENGMTAVNPDISHFEIHDGKIKVEITYESSDVAIIFRSHLKYLKGNDTEEIKNACWIQKEKTRAVLTCNAKYSGDYKLELYGGKSDMPFLFEYDIHSTKNVPDLPDFPRVDSDFSKTYSQLIVPLYDPLPRGEFVNFKVRTTEFENLFVKSGPVKVELENDGNGLFTGEIYIVGNLTYLLNSNQEPLVLYSTVLSPNVDVEPTYPISYPVRPNVLYSPLIKTLKIGKSYDFKIRCKKCLKLIVKDDKYDYTTLTRNGDMYTGTVKITGKNGDVKIINKIATTKYILYSYDISN